MILDGLATRYHLLPTEVLSRADTLDYIVMDVAVTWMNYQQAVAHAKASNQPPPAPPMSINKMQEMMERVRR
jgi:hypothetical protein